MIVVRVAVGIASVVAAGLIGWLIATLRGRIDKLTTERLNLTAECTRLREGWRLADQENAYKIDKLFSDSDRACDALRKILIEEGLYTGGEVARVHGIDRLVKMAEDSLRHARLTIGTQRERIRFLESDLRAGDTAVVPIYQPKGGITP